MAKLADATRPLTRAQRSQLEPIDLTAEFFTGKMKKADLGGIDAPQDQPRISQRLKCPLPLVQAEPDGLRQYYRGEVPQTRIVVPTGLL